MKRKSQLERKTKETAITLDLDLDGRGKYQIETGVPFFDHMLAQLARHGKLDMELKAKGDIEIDFHHTVEDVGILLGKAFKQAIGDKKGIRRFGQSLLPMDDVLSRIVLDISGRPYLYCDLDFNSPYVGQFPVELVEEFLRAFTTHSGITLHAEILHGSNTHHQIEAVFKGLGRSLGSAIEVIDTDIPSTKGVLE